MHPYLRQRKPQEGLPESEFRVDASYLLALRFVLTCVDVFAFLVLQTYMVSWR